ncbi:MAG: carboxypeptidase regulatory-like domain-containing protein [Pyrinomonadaceae bacterium]|nr:carboxypeptidase regulatory-like domain-containing protein [Pyrinomonadaceae bacterium]
MKRISVDSNLPRVAYSIFVFVLVGCVGYVLVGPATGVGAQKFDSKIVVNPTERLATSTFPTSTTLPLAIPDNVPAGTSASIPVSGLTDQVRGVALNVTYDQPAGGGGHTWVGDLNVVLTEPGGNFHTIHSRTGSSTGTGAGDSSDAQGPYTFTDGTANDWWATAVSTIGGTIAPGSYRTHANGSATPTDMNPVFQGPALADTRSIFERKSNSSKKSGPIDRTDNLGNGTWTLAVSDNAGGDTGRIAALSLTITTLAPTSALADIRGGVRSSTGGPIGNAYVTILNTETNDTYTVRTGPLGLFRFEGLPVGNFYTMWVEHGRYTFDQPVQQFTLDGDVGDAVFIAN